MKKIVGLILAILLASIIYFIILPVYKTYNLNKDLKNVNYIIAYTKNYYGYNSPDNELLDSKEVFNKIGFKGTIPSYTELHISNKEVAAAIVYNNTCYYKNYNEDIKSTTITNNSKCSIYGIVSDDNCFIVDGSTITGYKKTCNKIVNIPEKINNVLITEIKDNAFSDLGIKQVVIPDSIKKIGDNAFSNNSISYLVVRAEEIGSNAFSNNNIQSLTLYSSIVGNEAFKDNTINELNITESVKIIGNEAFSNNDLKHVYVVKSVTKLGDKAFYNNKLESIVLSKGLLEIGEGCFMKNKLTNVVIPSTVTSIKENAFYKDSTSNSDLSLLYNATKNSFDFTKIIGPNYQTVDISKI